MTSMPKSLNKTSGFRTSLLGFHISTSRVADIFVEVGKHGVLVKKGLNLMKNSENE